jgi:type IV secretory pathway VirB6-like protein
MFSTRLDQLYYSLETPGVSAILNVVEILRWLLTVIMIILAEAAVFLVISFGYIASAICVLLGPVFIPFFIVPSLDWLFWSWLKSFVQYSFMPVVANAFILVFERFLSGYLQTLPPALRLEEQLLFGVHAVMILVTFTVGVLLVPSLTSSIFSGRSGEAVTPSRVF